MKEGAEQVVGSQHATAWVMRFQRSPGQLNEARERERDLSTRELVVEVGLVDE